MTARRRNLWPLLLALGLVFTLLNLSELVLRDGGWPQIVGAALGVTLVAIAIARRRGWAGVTR
jgi:CHASE2 domain-containing sensor protein